MKRIILEVSDRKAAFIQLLVESVEEVHLAKIESMDELTQAEFIAEFKSGIEALNAINRGEQEARPAKDLLDELRGKNH